MKPVYEYDTIKEAIGYCTEGEWVKKSNPKLDALLQDDMFRDYIWASIRCMHAKNEMADIEKQHLDAVSRYKGYLEEENRCRKRIQVSLFPENFFEQLLGGGDGKMKIIDGDELLEELWRSDVSSREKIAEIVKKQPKIDLKNVELLYLEEEIKALWGEIDKLKDKNAKKEIDKTETYLPNTNENFGKLMLDVIKNAICDEVWKIRPEMSQKDILKGLEDGRIKITCARNSNWPFGMPFIPPKIIFE